MKDLLIKHYTESSKSTKQKGLDWYVKAHEICWRLATKHRIPVVKVAGVMAALSPSNKWERNIIDTESLIVLGEKAKVCTYGKNKEKALAIMALPDCLPSAVDAILQGPKITAFFRNIYRPLADGHVTLDRWALRAVDMDKVSLTAKRRAEILQAYREAAQDVGVRAHELQAIVWEQIRKPA